MLLLGLAEVSKNGAVRDGFTSVRSTIPKDAAIKLNIKPGDRVIFCENSSGEVVIRKNGAKP